MLPNLLWCSGQFGQIEGMERPKAVTLDGKSLLGNIYRVSHQA
jgi:hypothetical protein